MSPSGPGQLPAGPRVVAVGGGHGLAATIRAVRRYAGRVTAVVATADDGGSTGRLRAGMPSLPAPGDVRRCLAAMASGRLSDTMPPTPGVGLVDVPLDGPLSDALDFRFPGTDIEGHPLGNLLLAALTSTTGDFAVAVEEVSRLLGLDPAVAQVVPATAGPVRLHGRTASGRDVVGEVAVSGTEGIDIVRAVGEDGTCPPAPKAIVQALAEADQVVLGPGSLYSSVLSAAAVEDVGRGIASSPGRRIYVCNLRAEVAETRGYGVGDHVDALVRHGIEPDVVVVQPEAYPPWYAAGVQVVEADVARPHGLAHDAVKLGAVLASLLP